MRASERRLFSVQTTSPLVDYLESSFVNAGVAARRADNEEARHDNVIVLAEPSSAPVCTRREVCSLPAPVISSCTASWLKPSIDHLARADTPWKTWPPCPLSKDKPTLSWYQRAPPFYRPWPWLLRCFSPVTVTCIKFTPGTFHSGRGDQSMTRVYCNFFGIITFVNSFILWGPGLLGDFYFFITSVLGFVDYSGTTWVGP